MVTKFYKSSVFLHIRVLISDGLNSHDLGKLKYDVWKNTPDIFGCLPSR